MRRTGVCALILSAVPSLLGLSACAASAPAVDTNLVDGWPPMPPAEQFVPQAGTCHQQRLEHISYADYRPEPCSNLHALETVFVGEFDGAAARRVSPPAPRTKGIAEAFAVCDRETSRFLGRQWRDWSLSLSVAVPTLAAWSGGARWFRCDLAQLALVGDPASEIVRRSGSLRSAQAASLMLGCYRYRPRGQLVAVACGVPHNAEYVGTVVAPSLMPYPVNKKQWGPIYDRCWELVGRFVGISNARYQVGLHVVTATAAGWQAGDRGVRCLLWLNEGEMLASARDSRGKGLRYRG